MSARHQICLDNMPQDKTSIRTFCLLAALTPLLDQWLGHSFKNNGFCACILTPVPLAHFELLMSRFTWTGDLLTRRQRTDPTWRWGEGHELAFWLLRKAWEASSSSITLRKILLLSNIASTGCSRIFSRSSGAEGGLGGSLSNTLRSNEISVSSHPLLQLSSSFSVMVLLLLYSALEKKSICDLSCA